MNKFKPYRIFEIPEQVVINETLRRIRVTGRPHSKQEVLNDIILEYPELIKRLGDLESKPLKK